METSVSPQTAGVKACCVKAAPPAPTEPLATRLLGLWSRIDKPLLSIAAIIVFIAVALPGQLQASLAATGTSLLNIAPWIALSVALAAYATASRADRLVAQAFTGNPVRMIAVAALVGAASPFCSCGVVPIIAGLLMAGVPLAPVMAFWMSSPLMDPTMFIMTAASLGLEFAVVKTVAAVVIGLFAGGAVHLLARYNIAVDMLRQGPVKKCCSKKKAADSAPEWKFWQSAQSRTAFWESVRSNGWFLLRWMTIAFLLESLMTVFLPAEKVTAWLGQGPTAIPLAIAIGIPSYLNGYAALPLVSGLIGLGMSKAVALAFLVGGGVTSVPAMIAVWALVKPRGFALYMALAVAGSFLVSYAYVLYLAVA
ncbi:permease [Ramlibacter sp.]|uniref:permease n=1 Tax=Ramlibacter sp. TaxID=1917967 RepID=UPI0018505811|nr:permease [Ramlibacter sp.]MBA2672388.1 permease [Ramlibacter sp.]